MDNMKNKRRGNQTDKWEEETDEKMYKFKSLKNIFVVSSKQGTNMITDL